MDLHFKVQACSLMQVREAMFHIPSPPQQIEQLNEVKHRKLLVVLQWLGYAADAEGT